MQIAVTGVALAAGGLHHQEALAVDRDVEWIAGRLEGALLQVVERAAVLHIADPAVGPLEIVLMRARVQIFLEQHALGLEAGGVDVRNVVGDDVELPLQHHLPRKSDEKGVLHRSCSPFERPATKALPD